DVPGYHLVPEKTTGDTPTGTYNTGKPTETTYVYAKDQSNLVVNKDQESTVINQNNSDNSAKKDESDNAQKTTLPKTGESTNSTVMAGIVGSIVSALGLTALSKRRKK
ncbi:MAG: LPXTG cell wall anchor domain-containing protein, partial [Lactobacillaceae bacterium]